MTTAAVSVLHVVSAGEVGGAERMLVDLARRGESTGVRHAVALFTPAAPRDPLRRFLREAQIEVHDAGAASEAPLALLRRTFGGAAIGFVKDTARRVGARLIHVHTFASQALGTRAASQLGVPLIRTEHSTRVYDDPSCWPFARYSLARAAAVVAISTHLADVVRRRAAFAADKLVVVPCGIDPSRFPFVPLSSSTATTREPLRFVAVGRLDARKGFDRAIEAMRELPDARLEIVGDGEERGTLQALVARLGLGDRVTLAGWQADPAPSIARADVALCSSRQEGLGLALLEAMAVGRAVVTVPVGGVVEFVHDGETGFVASGTTATDLGRAMRRAIEQRRELSTLGLNARDLVLARYTADVMARGYAEVYARVLAAT